MSEEPRTNPISPGSWESTFPADPESESGSILFMQRLTLICISHYIHSRQLLPHSSFKKRSLCGVRFNYFDPKNEDAVRVLKTLRNSAEAIKQKYLRTLQLCINENPMDLYTASEVFTIRFRYDGDHSALEVSSDGWLKEFKYLGPEEFKAQTTALIEKIAKITKHLDAIPLEADFTIRMMYYPYTPSSYSPPLFRRIFRDLIYKEDAESVDVGSLRNTNFGCMMTLKSKYIEDHIELEVEKFKVTTKNERISSDLVTLEAMRGSLNSTVEGNLTLDVGGASNFSFITPSEQRAVEVEGSRVFHVAANTTSTSELSGLSAGSKGVATIAAATKCLDIRSSPKSSSEKDESNREIDIKRKVLPPSMIKRMKIEKTKESNKRVNRQPPRERV